MKKEMTLVKKCLLDFESLKEKYKVMSVPCMVINDTQVYFGKKNLQQLVEILEN